MSSTLESSVHVLVQPWVQNQAKKPAFKRFRFTSKGLSGSLVEDSGKKKAAPNDSEVTVFRYAPKADHLKEARILVKRYSAKNQPVIAVTSPSVFNQPQFRSILLENNVEVLVEEQDQFEVKQLVPWIARLIKVVPHPKLSAQKTASKQTQPASDPLDIGKRLRDPVSGRLDARKIATLLGISITDLATKVCEVTKQSLSQNPTSAGIQDKLQPLEEVAQGLLWCGGDEAKLRAWLNRPNPDFPMIKGKVPSPMDLILRGHAGIVASKLRNLLTGHPA